MRRENLGMLAMLALMMMLLAWLNAPARGEEATTLYVTGVREGKYLRGRSAPTTDSDNEEARFYNGESLTVYEIRDGWARVKGGESGEVWCSLAYLTSEAPGSEQSEQTEYRVSANGRVRVRTAPEGEFVRWLENGDAVTVTRRCDGWAFIGDGYVQGKYLEEAGEETP